LGASAASSLRDRFADVMLDVCWALFEIRVRTSSTVDPSRVWAELTSTYLGIVPHPTLPWWAMRGQLVQEPGYMANYALGPLVPADLRALLRRELGDWTSGQPDFHPWFSERVLRFGASKSSGAVLRDVLGRPPSVGALLAAVSSAPDQDTARIVVQDPRQVPDPAPKLGVPARR
jgi:hypothetical protein